MTTLQTLATFITILALFVTGVFLTHRSDEKTGKAAAKEALFWGLAFVLGFSGYFLANTLALQINLR